MSTVCILLVILTTFITACSSGTSEKSDEASYPTQQQQTVEAAVASYFTQTAQAQSVQTNFDQALTATAIPQATIATQSALALAENFSGIRNADWIPYIQQFDGVDMVLVPGGCFTTGSDSSRNFDICLETFWIDRTEVTNAQFFTFNGQAEQPGEWTDADYPRNEIHWAEANDFCQRRGARLPTEAEWEYAARGPDRLIYPWGNTFEEAYVVSSETSGQQTAPVGSKPGGASWVGALDMSGNVAEWVVDRYDGEPFSDDSHILRGGSWNSSSTADDQELRTYTYNVWYSNLGDSYDGFRCVRSN